MKKRFFPSNSSFQKTLVRGEKHSIITIIKATNGSGYWQTRGSADWERRLAAGENPFHPLNSCTSCPALNHRVSLASTPHSSLLTPNCSLHVHFDDVAVDENIVSLNGRAVVNLRSPNAGELEFFGIVFVNLPCQI